MSLKSTKTSLKIQNATKYYNDFKALDDVNLTIEQGSFFTILGPSGSGKTTLLKSIAGFEHISGGNIILDNEEITKIKPHKRNIGMVFQNYALFPHMTVFDNVAYALKIRKVPKPDIKNQVIKMLELIKMSEFVDRYPNQLSGGQQQRIALARAIIFNPDVLLLDEPLSALDKKLRREMQIEIKNIQKKFGITTVSVTHDQEEALVMSDQICVMNGGKIIQVDTPENIYKYPNSMFIAQFLGDINLFSGTLVDIQTDLARVALKGEQILSVRLDGDKLKEQSINKHVFIGIRPENIQLVEGMGEFSNNFNVTVTEQVYLGESIKVKVMTPFDESLVIKIPSLKGRHIKIGDQIKIGWDEEEACLLDE